MSNNHIPTPQNEVKSAALYLKSAAQSLRNKKCPDSLNVYGSVVCCTLAKSAGRKLKCSTVLRFVSTKRKSSVSEVSCTLQFVRASESSIVYQILRRLIYSAAAMGCLCCGGGGQGKAISYRYRMERDGEGAMIRLHIGLSCSSQRQIEEERCMYTQLDHIARRTAAQNHK